MSGIFGFISPGYLLGKRFRQNLTFCRDAQWWSKEKNLEFQLAQVRRVCRLALEKAPYYREIFTSAGFHPDHLDSLSDLGVLPTIDKNTVREHLDDMVTFSPHSPEVDFVSTGGTSGVPLHFYQDAGRSAVEFAYLVTSWDRVGYHLGDPLAVFRGRVVEPDRTGFRHEFDPLLRHHYYSNFHMTEEMIRRYLDHLATLGPCFLHVYPSSVNTLARFIQRSGLPSPANIRGIIAESEIISPDQRKLAEEIFHCRYFSCYGHTEKLVFTAECEHSTDDHVWPTYGYFELLDEQNRPVNKPGQRGEIVGTGFMKTPVSLIRYRTGDFATYVDDHCPACGRQHTLLRDIQGHRVQEMLVAHDGSEISWTAMNMHDDTFLHVRQFQFFQNTPGKALLRIVPEQPLSSNDLERIRTNLDHKFTGRIQFDINFVESIPLSPRGKAIYVDQRLKPSV